MNNRDRHLLQLRPKLALQHTGQSSLEAFQWETLHPVLKLQNTLILALISVYLRKYCPHFPDRTLSEKRAYIQTLLHRDARPRHMLVGLAAGQFTEEEFAFFCKHEPELRRRLLDLCIQHVQEQVEELPLDLPAA